MNIFHTDLLKGFSYAIGITGASQVNDRRYALLETILHPGVTIMIKSTFKNNIFEPKWKPYHSTKYPLQTNMQICTEFENNSKHVVY